MIQITECPICGSGHFSPYLTLKDHMITGEVFTLVKCNDCSFVFTNPIPELKDLGKYYKSEEYVSHSSSQKGIINKLYHTVRKRTLRDKVSWIKKHIKGNRLLDFGCGTGHFLAFANTQGLNGIGLEPDEDARRFSAEINGLKVFSREDMPVVNEKFDAITLWHVLEHLPQLNEDIEWLKQHLEDKGVLFVAVPNPSSYDANKYKEYWAGYDVPRHLYHFSQENIQRLFLKHGLDLKEVIPMKYDAYYVSMLSEKYKKGSTIQAILSGWRSNKRAREQGFSSQVYVFKKA